MDLLKAAENISIVIHNLEARGVELTKAEDQEWLMLTDAILEERKRRGLKEGEEA